MSEKELGIGELLDETYLKLFEKHNPKKLSFEKKALSEIANDSDYHRTRIGYMGYEGVGLFELDGKTWAISRGAKCGNYPGDMYVGDIIALDLVIDEKNEEKIAGELSEKIGRGAYFMNSLFLGLDDGNLATRKMGVWDIPTRFGERMMGVISQRMEEFVMQTPEYNQELISLSTLGPIPTKVMLYKPETPSFLADCIEKVLRETEESST